MGRRLHDLTEESDNLIRLSGRRRSKRTSPTGGRTGHWPVSWKLAVPLGLLAILIAGLLLPTPLRTALLSPLGVAPLTDESALQLSTAMGFDPDQASAESFRAAYGGLLSFGMAMQACTDAWSEFRDVSSFLASGKSAMWRAGEITGVLTPALRAEMAQMVAYIETIRQSGLATLGTPSDRLECLTVAQGYRMIGAKFHATLL